jgi:hypothetical protein
MILIDRDSLTAGLPLNSVSSLVAYVGTWKFMKIYPFQVPPYLYSGNFFATRQHSSQTKTQTFPLIICIQYIIVNSLVQVWHIFVFIFINTDSFDWR